MASKNISFDNIPSSIRKPGRYIEFNTRLATRNLSTNEQSMLIVAQRTSTGTVLALVPTQIFSDAEAEAYFGAGSMAHIMARAAIKANAYLDLTVIALDDASAGVAATGTITIGGPATSSGVVTLYVANQKIEISVASGDTAAEIAAALKAELDNNTDLPVTAAVAAAVVTLTAKNKGLCGNDIGLGYRLTNAAGVTVTIVALASGAANPDIADALAVIFADEYDIIVTPYNTQEGLSSLSDHLDDVSGPLEQRPATAVYAMTGALAAATTLAPLINSGRIIGAHLRYTSATARKSMPCEIAAAFGAVMAWEEDPARPLNTLELKKITVPAINDRLSKNEQESELHNGVTPLEIVNETVQIVRAISTYLHNTSGVDDTSLLDITTIRTLDYVRKNIRDRIGLRFPREKLSSKTPPRVKAEILDVLMKLEDLEMVEEVQANKAGVIVERDEQDVNRLNAKIPCDVVNGLHIFAGRIDLLL